MSGIRRAFLWASAGRYIVMGVNLAITVVMARLLAPGEYGVSALGSAIFAIAVAIRALGGGAYLIQRKELAPENIRTTFTVSLIVTLLLTATLAFLAEPLTRYFRTPDLERYLLVSAIGYLTGPFVYPIIALMSRQMDFAAIARISVVTASVNAVASIFLALLGFSYMSFAWASAISAAAGMLLCFHFWLARLVDLSALVERVARRLRIRDLGQCEGGACPNRRIPTLSHFRKNFECRGGRSGAARSGAVSFSRAGQF